MGFELRLALRSLWRQPLLATALIVTVGLAVATNTALFSIFDGLLFRPLPYANVDRIVHVEIPTAVRRNLPRADFDRLAELLQTTPLLEERAAARPSGLLEEGAAEVEALKLRPVHVTAGWYQLLGIRPIVGQLPDGTAESSQGVLISEDLWRTRYGADLELLGTPLDIPGLTFRRRPILRGVLPKDVAVPDGANLWFSSSDLRNFNFARMAEGVTVAQVRSALRGVVVTPFREYVRPDGAYALGILLGATGLLMLVAWIQIAALLFARAVSRASEIGVRLALGASRDRVVRQFAAEGALIVAAALGLAWMLVPALTSGIVRLLPEVMTRGQILQPDLRALVFSAALSVAGLILLSVAPLGIIRRSSPVNLLRGSFLGTERAGATRTRTAMLVTQLALTAVLLYMSGLTVRSFERIKQADLGFTPARVVAIRLPPVTVSGSTTEQRRAHLQRQVTQTEETYAAIRALPHVEAVAGGRLPFYESALYRVHPAPVKVAGETEARFNASVWHMTPGYLKVLGIQVIAGRPPEEQDLGAGYSANVVVNNSFARQLAERRRVIGQQLEVNNYNLRVAAVVEDFATTRPDRPIEPQVFLVGSRPQMFILAKVRPDAGEAEAGAAIASVFGRIWPENPDRELLELRTLTDRAVADYRARATLLTLIGVMCLPLAIAGIAGTVSYATKQRTREIGIRMALGAEPRDIRQSFTRAGLAAVTAGALAGVGGGILMGRAMSSYLFDVRAADPVVMIASVALVMTVGWISAYVPSLRAARIAPADALREG
jgi:predicted permease